MVLAMKLNVFFKEVKSYFIYLLLSIIYHTIIDKEAY